MLALHNFVRNVQDCLLPLVNALDQEFPAANFFSDIIPNVRSIRSVRHQVFVGFADSQMWNLISVQRDRVFVAHFVDAHVRQHVAIWIGSKNLAGFGIESGNEICGPLHLLDGDTEPASHFRKSFASEIFKVLVHNLVFEASFLSKTTQLN